MTHKTWRSPSYENISCGIITTAQILSWCPLHHHLYDLDVTKAVCRNTNHTFVVGDDIVGVGANVCPFSWISYIFKTVVIIIIAHFCRPNARRKVQGSKIEDRYLWFSTQRKVGELNFKIPLSSLLCTTKMWNVAKITVYPIFTRKTCNINWAGWTGVSIILAWLFTLLFGILGRL